MLTSAEYKSLYALLDTYLSSDACQTAFIKKDNSGIAYENMTLSIDESICENYDYANPNKIKDKVNILNGKNDFNKALVAIKNKNNEIIHTIKYFDLPK